MFRSFIFAGAVAAAAITLAACGGGNGYSSSASTPATQAAVTTAAPTNATSSSPTTAPTSAPAAASTIKTGDTAKGRVLTDAAGFTLYTFKNDATPGKSSCNGGCATTWPPTIASSVPADPAGVTGTFALISRDDGMKQVTFNGQPLYRYAPDKAPGDANGDGVGNVWFVAKVTAAAAGSPTTTTTNADTAGGAYGY